MGKEPQGSVEKEQGEKEGEGAIRQTWGVSTGWGTRKRQNAAPGI